LDEFENLNIESPRNILGEIFFPLIHKISPYLAPKITGMIIDLKVSTISEILTLLKDSD